MSKKIKVKGIRNDLIITCPACGYSFRFLDPTSKKAKKKCPMCGSYVKEPHFPPDRQDNFKKRIF